MGPATSPRVLLLCFITACFVQFFGISSTVVGYSYPACTCIELVMELWVHLVTVTVALKLSLSFVQDKLSPKMPEEGEKEMSKEPKILIAGQKRVSRDTSSLGEWSSLQELALG